MDSPSAAGPVDTTEPTTSATLLSFGALVLESRRLLLQLSLGGALLALLIVTLVGPRYSAVASFMPQASGDNDLSALMGLAGQFGIPLSSASTAPSPDLYATLASSPMVLDPIAREMFPRTRTVAEPAESLAVLLRVRPKAPVRRHEKVIEKLQGRISAGVNRRTGVIVLQVRTRWPGVSLGIAERILEELNAFNLHKRQSQARAERVFAEGRARDARARLTAAEDAARDFAVRNREIDRSPALRLEADRLQREVNLRQQLLQTTEQSLEAARVREVQDTPVLTVFQQPRVRSVPDPRGRIKWTILGGILGLLLAAVVLPVRAFLGSARDARSPEAERFRAALAATHRPRPGPLASRTDD